MTPIQKLKHPSGLYVLFFTEMWERFSYYLMLALLALYIKAPATPDGKGGLGMTESKAIGIYGFYIALVYLTPYYGGMVADRLLGYRKTVIIGALLMCAGHLCMALPGETTFYVALGLLILGNGAFKPNISTMVGSLYPEGSPLKDSAYSIFYMGINVGAGLAPLIAGLMRTGKIPFSDIQLLQENFGWHWAFGSAAAGMFLSAILFIVFKKPIEHADTAAQRVAMRRANPQPAPAKPPELVARQMKFMIAGAIIVLYTALSMSGVIPGIVSLHNPLTMLVETVSVIRGHVDVMKVPVRPIDAFFWGAALITLLVMMWPRVDVVETEEDAPPAVQKERVNALFIIFGVVVLFWMAFHQNGSTLTFWAEQNTRTTWSPEIFQFFNAFFVVSLTPLMVGGWALLRKRGAEPSTPAKVGIGMLLTASCYLIMAMGGFAGGDTGRVSMSWLVMGYMVITMGELCLSPVGLSLVSKLAPQARRGALMGGWFLATSIGNKLAGDVGEELWSEMPHSRFFLILVGFCLLAAVVLRAFLPRLRRAMPVEKV
jgi:POT family proton-dependent oligopeptide transporter